MNNPQKITTLLRHALVVIEPRAYEMALRYAHGASVHFILNASATSMRVTSYGIFELRK